MSHCTPVFWYSRTGSNTMFLTLVLARRESEHVADAVNFGTEKREHGFFLIQVSGCVRLKGW